MATFNDLFSQRLGRNLPSANPIPKVDINARRQNDFRFQKLAAILEEDKKRQTTRTQPKTPSLDGDNEQVVTDNAGFSVMNPLESIGRGVLNVGARGLDVISRPAYSLFEGLKEASESANEGQNVLQAMDDTLGGFWSGLSGKEKTGFGEVIEANAQRSPGSLNPLQYAFSPLNLLGEGLNSEKVPDKVSINTKRVLGLAGELGLDPLNYVGVGLVGKFGKGGKAVTEFDDIKNAVKATVRQSADDLGYAPLLDKKVMQSAGVGVDGGKISRNLPQSKKFIDDVVDKAFDDTMLELEKGLTSGRYLGGELLPATVATKATESLRGLYFKDFDEALGKFLAHVDGTDNLSAKELDDLFRAKNSPLKGFDQRILETHIKEGHKKYNTLEEFFFDRARLNASGDNTLKIIGKAADAYKAEFDTIAKRLQDDIFKKLEGQMYNAPAIKIGNKTVASLDRVGKAYADFRGKHLQGAGLKGVSYNKTFPGRTSLMNQRIRSLGIKKYEQFHKEVKAVARGLTKKERELIHRSILLGDDLTDPRLREAQIFVKNKYAEMWLEEVANGVHKIDPDKPFNAVADNYVYLYYKKGRGKGLDRIRQANKEAVKLNGNLPTTALQEAIDKGLAPVQDAFEALLLRQIKSNRDLSRSLFMTDLLDHYGIKANRLSKNNARDLTKVSASLPDTIRRELKTGDEWFLPDDIHNIYQKYLETISLGSSEETAALLRTYDKLTRMFKVSATLPYPGFHIRNSLGDIFMSSLDGVQFRDYAILNRLKYNKLRGVVKDITIGGDKFTYDELHDLYLKNAASGNFMSTDLGVEELVAKVNPNVVIDKAKALSEYRENFFREAHFLKAFKEEYPGALRKAKDPKIARRNAAEAATYRVNKSLFDYGALTRIERQGFRRAMPFYTYSRKVMPALMEAALLNPRNLSRVNRWFIDEEARGDSMNFNDMLVPPYAREIGYAQITDEAEPWILRADFLPTSVAKDNLNFSSAEGFGANLLQNLNPILKAAPELGLGRTAFDNREVTSSADYVGGAAFPFLGPIADISNKLGGPNLSGVPGLNRFTGKSTKDAAEVALSNRFSLGLPFDKIKENQQAAALYTITADIKRELSKVSDKIKSSGLSIYVSQRKEGTSFRVRDDESGQVLFESLDAKAAADFATRAANAKNKFRSNG